jgi:hypothetical protein
LPEKLQQIVYAPDLVLCFLYMNREGALQILGVSGADYSGQLLVRIYFPIEGSIIMTMRHDYAPAIQSLA